MSGEIRLASDEALAARIAAGDAEEACAELFRRHRRRVYLWCYRYTHDVDDAVDCTQAIFVKVVQNASAFAGRSRFTTWLYRIVRNHCLSELSRRRDEWRRRAVDIEELELSDGSEEERTRRLELETQLDELLASARDRMAEQELEAFVLHYRDGLTVKEVTKVLGCENITGARTLIQNARRKFRRMVQVKGGSHE